MPKPPMSDVITVLEPIVGSDGKPLKDSYGRFKYNERITKARVQHTTKVVRDSQGQEMQALLVIDLPPDVKVGYGYEIRWLDRFKQLVKGAIIGIDEVLNFTGNKVYFRTVYIGKG
jgi:hypothetical protein